jgi:hypothetical protein
MAHQVIRAVSTLWAAAAGALVRDADTAVRQAAAGLRTTFGR